MRLKSPYGWLLILLSLAACSPWHQGKNPAADAAAATDSLQVDLAFPDGERTGLQASWHGTPNAGNLLFLDGSVRFMSVAPRPEVGAAVFDPLEPALAFPREK